MLSAQYEHNKAVDNYNDAKKLYEIAKKRFEIGGLIKSELLQMELSMLNSDLAINNSKVNLDMATFTFNSYIGITQKTIWELMPQCLLPGQKLIEVFNWI